MKIDKEFKQKMSQEIDAARAQLEQSKHVRQSLQATIQRADEVSKKTHMLLNKKQTLPGPR